MVAAVFCSAVASGACAFLSAVRKAERCARLRTVAARDLRMFFLADAIFGTNWSLSKWKNRPSAALAREGVRLTERADFKDVEARVRMHQSQAR